MIKKAIILSAGRGRRMGNLTKKIPKCLLRLQNKTLIEILISKLRLNKIKDISNAMETLMEQSEKHDLFLPDLTKKFKIV